MRLILVLPTLLALLACQPTRTDPPADEPTTDTPTTDTPTTATPITEEPGAMPVANPDASEPVDGEAKVVVLAAFEREVGVAVGSIMHYEFKSHASVGYGAKQKCSDETVVRYVRTDTVYKKSEAERAGMDGADAATGTFVFEAVAPGTATVTIDEMFRGSSEQSVTFTIVVRE